MKAVKVISSCQNIISWLLAPWNFLFQDHLFIPFDWMIYSSINQAHTHSDLALFLCLWQTKEETEHRSLLIIVPLPNYLWHPFLVSLSDSLSLFLYPQPCHHAMAILSLFRTRFAFSSWNLIIPYPLYTYLYQIYKRAASPSLSLSLSIFLFPCMCKGFSFHCFKIQDLLLSLPRCDFGIIFCTSFFQL